MNNSYCVYVHIMPDGKRYYGMTSQKPKKRWGKNGRGYKKKNINFFNDILFYGWDNIEHIIVAKGLSKDEAEWLEEELIRANKTYDSEYGYNIRVGLKWTDYNSPMYGKKHTDEAKSKMSKMRKGKHYTEKTRAKMSEAKSGANNPTSKSVICLTTNMIFDTMMEASDYYGIQQSNISMCCRGITKSAGKLNGQKLVWRYITITKID